VRRFELSSEISGDPADAWVKLSDLSTYSSWNSLIPAAEGTLSPGSQVNLRVLGPGGFARTFRPEVLSVEAPHQIRFAGSLGHRNLVHMVHTLELIGSTPRFVLRQQWEVTGVLVPLVWPLLVAGMRRFARVGSDLEALRR